MVENVKLPWWWEKVCDISTVISLGITTYAITMHFLNYRKPYEQRLIIRIQLIVPIFAVTSLVAVKSPTICQFYLDPVREVYEAFVIYTFFSLLVLILGGERRIITEVCLDQRSSTYAIPLLARYFGKIDLSYPEDFLIVKRSILQYVWFKPLYCVGNLVCLVYEIPYLNVILLTIYNLSVSLSLCSLAVFWKCLYQELRPFNPWGKFLCVKIVIFASYWQSMVFKFLASKCILHGGNAGFVYQNGLLCVEMVAIALLHLVTFPWRQYSAIEMPHCGRMYYINAIRDCFGGRDLKWDFDQTIRGHSYYNCRNFDPTVESALVAKADASSKLHRITEGLRFENQGQSRHWLGYGSTVNESNSDNGKKKGRGRSSIEVEQWYNNISTQKYVPTDPNYPVSVDLSTSHRNTQSMRDLRKNINNKVSVT